MCSVHKVTTPSSPDRECTCQLRPCKLARLPCQLTPASVLKIDPPKRLPSNEDGRSSACADLRQSPSGTCQLPANIRSEVLAAWRKVRSIRCVAGSILKSLRSLDGVFLCCDSFPGTCLGLVPAQFMLVVEVRSQSQLVEPVY